MEKRIDVVHVGASGVPFERSASVNRCLAIYSILTEDKFNVLAINNAVSQSDKSVINIQKKGVYAGIEYQYTTPSPYKSNSFFKRRFDNFISPINEFFLLFKLGFERKIGILIFYPKGTFFDLIFYRTISKLFNAPLVSHYVEYRSSFESRKKIWQRINDYLFDKYFMFFVDGVLPISQFLMNHVKERRENIPMLKIPPLVNFNLFEEIKRNKETVNYFLYVGSAGYFKAIELLIEAFKDVKNKEYHLFLVLHGSGMEAVQQAVSKHPKKNLIKIVSNLAYKELIQLYKEAQALLIPLSDNVQDRARFPQKICEYLASANPIITTNYGEVSHYFKDTENALVAIEDSPLALSKKMNFVVENPQLSQEIGKKGYQTGLKYFDTNSYKTAIKEFLWQL